MTLNESIVEDAALEWFGELGYSCLGAEAITPALSQGEREKSEAIRRLNPAIPEEAAACASHADRRATVRKSRIVYIERRLNP